MPGNYQKYWGNGKGNRELSIHHELLDQEHWIDTRIVLVHVVGGGVPPRD